MMPQNKIEKKIETLFDLCKYEECIKLSLKHLHSSEVDLHTLYIYLIYSYYNLIDYDRADEFCDKALSDFSDIDTFFYLKSFVLLARQRPKTSKEFIEKALSKEPNNASYLAHYARVYMELDKPKKAKELIDKALSIDSHDLNYQVENALILFHLDRDKESKEMLDKVLAQDPFFEKALDLKQKIFTSKLNTKKSILKKLLNQNPFEKDYQEDMKFIKFYYRFIPLMMLLSIIFVYLLNIYEDELGIFKPFVFLFVGITAFIGSQDQRFNIPFLLVVSFIQLYFEDASLPAYLGGIFLAVIYSYLFYALFLFVDMLYMMAQKKISLLKGENRSVVRYFLYEYPFYDEEKVDKKGMKSYYIVIISLMLGSLALFIFYPYKIEGDIKIFFMVLSFMMAFVGAKNYLLAFIYLYASTLIINDLEYKSSLLYTIFIYPVILAIYNYIENREKDE